MHVCLAVTCHLHFWQNDQEILLATAVLNTGVERMLKSESAQKVDPEEENDPATLQTQDLSITSPAHYH